MDSQIKLNSEIYTFKLPLLKSIHIKNEIINYRAGLILGLSTGDEVVGYGEISPLPGLHKETYQEALAQLVTFCDNLSSSKLPRQELKNVHFFPDINLYPSVRFGVESALISFLSLDRNIRSVQILDPKNNVTQICVNGLITREENLQTQITFFIQNGYQAVKLKLGQNTIESDIEKVIYLHDQLNANVKIRLDANRCWSYSDAIQFSNGIKNIPIDYIEEPLMNPDELPKFVKETEMSVALDESLQEREYNSGFPDWCSAIILKPTVIGSVKKSIEFINMAQKSNKKSIISDTFQSGVGLSMLANLGALIGAEKIGMGLDTYRWLESDILENQIAIQNGNIDILAINKAQHQLNFSVLNKIY